MLKSSYTLCLLPIYDREIKLRVGFSHVIHLALGGKLQMETQLSDRLECLLWVLRSSLIENMCNVMKFACFRRA